MKNEIMKKANELIEMLDMCDDYDFIIEVTSRVADNAPFDLEN